MFEESRFEYKIKRLHRALGRARREHDRDKKAAESRRAPNAEIENISLHYQDFSEIIWHDIAKLKTQYLLEQMDGLGIPRPKVKLDGDEPTWEESHRAYLLTSVTAVKLREEIRKERKERSELPRLWLAIIAPLLSAVTGIIGATIGLIAFIAK
jgi:hypothetical protein